MAGTTVREATRLPRAKQEAVSAEEQQVLGDEEYDYMIATDRDRADVGDSPQSVSALTSLPDGERWEVDQPKWEGDRRQSRLRRLKSIGDRIRARDAASPPPVHAQMRVVAGIGGQSFQEAKARPLSANLPKVGDAERRQRELAAARQTPGATELLDKIAQETGAADDADGIDVSELV